MKIGLLKRDLNCNAWTTENLGDYYTGQSNFICSSRMPRPSFRFYKTEWPRPFRLFGLP